MVRTGGRPGLRLCRRRRLRTLPDATILAIAIASRTDGKSPQAVATARVRAALDKGFAPSQAAHALWWRKFCVTSALALPAAEAPIARQYHLVRYFHGAASRRGAPPMPLQGVWTADNGGLRLGKAITTTISTPR